MLPEKKQIREIQIATLDFFENVLMFPNIMDADIQGENLFILTPIF